MKKLIRIILKSLGIILSIILLLIGIVYFGSKMLGFKKTVDNPVYGPSSKWVYEATFFDLDGQVINTDTVTLTTYDERFLLVQNKITWSLNKRDGSFEAMEMTGIVETGQEIWIHPPRFKGYYEFTEYAPFPELNYPLKINKIWTGTLSLGTYATEKTGSKLDKEYFVKSIDTLSLTPIITESKIIGIGKCGLGTYKNEFTFNSQNGFTSMQYTKQTGEQLILELIDKQKIKL